ncbi:unnamed protein product [Lactuca saligna]|uniref:EF-hand domain-containing protein n=1 Tax=Lactuca saligna TaxID=75948 RepID=A0AA35YYR5_LACSI|nr:unnamed protein product [Lactuca saligna]
MASSTIKHVGDHHRRPSSARDIPAGCYRGKAIGDAIPTDYKYVKELLRVCDANSDERVDYQEFRRYMDDKELELYHIFQAIDVEHNGCILSEELYDALGIELDDDELASLKPPFMFSAIYFHFSIKCIYSCKDRFSPPSLPCHYLVRD